MRVLIICFLCLTACGCSGVQSVRLSAGYGPFSAEIEVILRQADDLEKANGPNCPAAAALRELARAKGAIPSPKKED